MMTGLDLWTAVAAAIACVCLGLRANMLKPGFASWCDAPTRVWASLLGVSLAAAITAISLFRGGAPATARESILMTALAIASAVMLLNLYRQSQRGLTSPDCPPEDAPPDAGL
jgi:hypothetical protein